MEQSGLDSVDCVHTTKEDDSCQQQVQYAYMTPVVTDQDLTVPHNSYHFCYSNSIAVTPPTDDETLENCESNDSIPDGDKKDPFSPNCRIPLPGLYGNNTFFDSTTFIRRRNERERARVRNVNDGFERLRQHLPLSPNLKDKRLSKVETLRFAITYIHHLQSLLASDNRSAEKK